MIQEYLFVSDKYKKDVQTLKKPEGATSNIKNFKNSECWIFSIELPGYSERAAKLLSFYHDDLMVKFSPTILTNESASYFNKRLYPLLNEFELKLRSFLYLASSCTKTPDDFKENIHDFERDSLGNIFNALFIDQGFINKVKQKVNDKPNFGKTKIENDISDIPETPLWDRAVPEDTVTTLRKNYSEVLDIRNAVMHAHDINFDIYIKDKKLIKTINNELTCAIEDIVKAAEEDRPSNVIFENFYSEVGKALTLAKETSGSLTAINVPDMISNINLESWSQENSVTKASKAIAKAVADLASEQNKKNSELIESLKNLNISNFDPSKTDIYIPFQVLGERLSEGVQPLKNIQGEDNQGKD